MMEKYQMRCRRMADWHFWCTVAGVLLFFVSSGTASAACLTVGAYSLYVTFCYAAFEEVEAVAKLCALWLVSYPVVHLLTYILARIKRWYLPILVMVWADLLFQLCAAAYMGTHDNLYGVNMVVPDIVISAGFAVVFARSFVRYRKERRADLK